MTRIQFQFLVSKKRGDNQKKFFITEICLFHKIIFFEFYISTSTSNKVLKMYYMFLSKSKSNA